MSEVRESLAYTKEHEWLRVDGACAWVGITDHAQETLGDITFVELPTVGQVFKQGDTFGVVESVKAASDLYIPVEGEILEINEGLETDPAIINQSPYDKGWIIKIAIKNSDQVKDLLDSEAYQSLPGI
ncbi:MAG: glycine cleavage system protein GcvH [Puniceicoccaceae bacterium]